MLEKLAVRNKRHDYYVKVSQHGVGILVNAISCKLSGREISSPLKYYDRATGEKHGCF